MKSRLSLIITLTANRAFESGRADEQRAFSLGPLRRAAQRER